MHRYRSQQPFDPHAGPWPTAYTAAEQQKQREAGAAALARFHESVARGDSTFKFESGVYRVDAAFEVVGCKGFKIQAAGVEIICEAEEWAAHFRILDCSDVSITGPVTLDASPFGMSQGTIVGTELHAYGQSHLIIQPHKGYPPPTKGHRICCFEPQTGRLLQHYQDPVVAVQTLEGGHIRVTMNENFCKLYALETAQAVQIGNLICLENTDAMRGGFEIRGCDGISMTDVSMHCFALTWGLPMSGRMAFKRFRGCRRPNTGRLMGGGFFAFACFGGKVVIDDCELAHNFDDLTDIASPLGFAFKPLAPNKIYVSFDYKPLMVPGTAFVFYNAYTLEPTGEATAVECVRNEDPAITRAFWAELKRASVLTQDCVAFLVTLDRDLPLSMLELVDCAQTRPKSMTITNSYIHDSLAAGISLKGAQRMHIQGNVIERAGYRGIGVGFDPYWWEGGVPSNITIKDNWIIDTPYNLPDLTPCINIYVDAAPEALARARGTPIHGVDISGNTIVNAHTAAIGVQYARQARVTGNRIINPMAAGLQTAWGQVCCYEHPAAILLNCVADVAVSSNRIVSPTPELIPNMICATAQTDRGQIRLADNSLSGPAGGQQQLPTTFFSKVSCCDCRNISLQGDWEQRDVPGCFSGRRLETAASGASATFAWRGSRARTYGTLKQGLGLADVLLDGRAVATLDLAALPSRFAAQLGAAGLHNQLLFDTGPLAAAKHELSLVVRDQGAPDQGVGAALEAFDFLDDAPPPPLDACKRGAKTSHEPVC